MTDANIHAATGVAIREFPLTPGFGFADYLLYVNKQSLADVRIWPAATVETMQTSAS